MTRPHAAVSLAEAGNEVLHLRLELLACQRLALGRRMGRMIIMAPCVLGMRCAKERQRAGRCAIADPEGIKCRAAEAGRRDKAAPGGSMGSVVH